MAEIGCSSVRGNISPEAMHKYNMLKNSGQTAGTINNNFLDSLRGREGCPIDGFESQNKQEKTSVTPGLNDKNSLKQQKESAGKIILQFRRKSSSPKISSKDIKKPHIVGLFSGFCVTLVQAASRFVIALFDYRLSRSKSCLWNSER